MSTTLIHPIVKPWAFRGWGLDFIGQINPPSLKGYHFVLVATDYFTKWTETIALKNMIHSRGNVYSDLSHLHKMTKSHSDIQYHPCRQVIIGV